MVIRALREGANDIEEEGRKPRVRWYPKLKISLLNTDSPTTCPRPTPNLERDMAEFAS